MLGPEWGEFGDTVKLGYNELGYNEQTEHIWLV
jgi:hypothetical protein